ncbi:MAG: Gldg family protein [Myxococcota bacterium]
MFKMLVVGRVAKKEFWSYFSSPLAYIFLGTFLFVSLFGFFWVESFFARNIADMRPLFDHMPLLLVFLVAALTMKSWSEERRMGTIEFLMTAPVQTHELVLGKFLANLALVSLALLLTLGVPCTVAYMGDVDWGPIVGGYFACILMAGGYVAIGLFVSACTENQVISLIVTTLLGLLFYVLGAPVFTGLFNNSIAESLKLLGSGSRFESVARGVIDLRDIYYYVSVMGVFLVLNTYALEKMRWAVGGTRKVSHTNQRLTAGLLIVNLLLANVWLQGQAYLRVDVTQGNIYSISAVSQKLLRQLQEPLLIRGYFSAKTHPLLSPLVPTIRDMLTEYGLVGGSNVRVEFIDPRGNETLEEEANRKYGIRPVPFHFSDRHQAELVNSYFHVLLQYGDQYEVLEFGDLIEVKQNQMGAPEVRLRNLEYDVSRSIKKVLYGFQSLDHLFATLTTPFEFVGYISDSNLPPSLLGFKKELIDTLKKYKERFQDKFEYQILDPSSNQELAKKIAADYGFRPMAAGLFNPKTFYFYMTLQQGNKLVPIQMPESLGTADLQQNMDAAFKRLAPGFLKTVGLMVPSQPPSRFGMQQRRTGPSFRVLQKKLAENYTVQDIDLESGVVPHEVDVLLLVTPKDLNKKQLFAFDQFVMKGGTALLVSSAYQIEQSQFGMRANLVTSGLDKWLKQAGVTIEKSLLLDEQNDQFPVMVRRNIGGFPIQEMKMVPYAFFPDIRASGFHKDQGITAGLSQLTMSWASPISIDQSSSNLTITPLISSSPQSWTTTNTTLTPDFKTYPKLGFKPADNPQSYVLASLLQGRFDSYFKGKKSPLLKQDDSSNKQQQQTGKKESELEPAIDAVIEKSPESARVILFASNAFLEDSTLQLSQMGGTRQFLNSLQLIENAIDWSVEDYALSSLRGRGQFSRTLYPMSKQTKKLWEYANYGIALLALCVVYLVISRMRKTNRRRLAHMLQAAKTAA